VTVQVPAKDPIEDSTALAESCETAQAIAICVDARSHDASSIKGYLERAGAALDACEATHGMEAHFLVLAHASGGGSGLWASYRQAAGLPEDTAPGPATESAGPMQSDAIDAPSSGAGGVAPGGAARAGSSSSNPGGWRELALEDVPEPDCDSESSERYDALRSACLDFTMERGWELLEADTDLGAATRGSREKEGVARLREALQSVMWRGMERGGAGRQSGGMGALGALMGMGMGMGAGGVGGIAGALHGSASDDADADAEGVVTRDDIAPESSHAGASVPQGWEMGKEQAYVEALARGENEASVDAVNTSGDGAGMQGGIVGPPAMMASEGEIEGSIDDHGKGKGTDEMEAMLGMM